MIHLRNHKEILHELFFAAQIRLYENLARFKMQRSVLRKSLMGHGQTARRLTCSLSRPHGWFPIGQRRPVKQPVTQPFPFSIPLYWIVLSKLYQLIVLE